MQQYLEFDIIIPFASHPKLAHIKDKSVYNHNYYKLQPYGDWVDYHGNDILLEDCDEEYNSYKYSFGRFEGDEYIPVFSYCTQDDVLSDIH